MFIFSKRAEKLNNITFLHFMTTFHNFTLKIDTSHVKRVVKPILKTRNAIDVSMYIWLVCFWIKNSKKDAI